MTDGFVADVLICGAGAAGLTLAIDLARRGVSFQLIEKCDEPFHGSRGKGIQPRTLEVFEDFGILDRVAATGSFYPKQREYRNDGTHIDSDMLDIGPPTPAEPYQRPLMLPQFLTERIMRERLTELGHRPRFGCELTGFTQDAQGVTARLTTRDGEQTLRTRWLVGADGGRSFIRHLLAVDFPGRTLGMRAIVADVTLSGLPRTVWHRFGEGAQQIFICSLAGTDLFQIQGPVAPEGEIDLSPEGLMALVAARTRRADIVVHAVSWASAFNMNARLAERYHQGRVFLAGDAAHTHPPTGGQGLNTSVQDAYNLGWKLGAVIDGAPEALLDTYEAERRPVAEAMLGLSVDLLDAMTRGKMRRGREVRQLDIGYPASSLGLEAPQWHGTLGHGRLAVGSRAPDAPVRGAAGQNVRLFGLFRGPHWTLLSQGDAPLSPRPGLHIHTFGERGDLVDDGGHFHAAYGLRPGDWVLVRPDGYIGATGTSVQGESIERYLAHVGLAVMPR